MCDQRTPTDNDLPWNRPVTRRDLLSYGGMLGFSAVGASMLASCAPVSEIGGAPLPQADAVPPASAKYLAVIILDAARGDYVHYGHLPNIRWLMRNGTHYPHAWCGQMEAITPASHASLGTGMFPKHDGGVLGFWWENPSTFEPYCCAPLHSDPDPHKPGGRHAIAPHIIETIVKDSKAPTLAGLMKDYDPAAKVYSGSGNKFYAADAMGGPDADYITYFWNNGPKEYRPVSVPGHEAPSDILHDSAFHTFDYGTMNVVEPGKQDSLVVDLAIKVIERERPRIVMLNLPELDWPVAHKYGGVNLAQPQVTHLMENADQALGRLFDTYRKLGIFHQTVFCVMGDHGVLPLQQLVDREPALQAVSNSGTNLGDGDFHTAGFLWMEDNSRAMKTTSFIDSAKMRGVKAVYFLNNLTGRPQYLPSIETVASIPRDLDRAYRYLLETMNGPTAPHVVLLYPERTGTVGAGGLQNWKGDHGGPSWASQHLVCAMAGPGIKKAHVSQFPARLVDLTPTFLRLLGAPYPRLDGTALADAFLKPTRHEARAQQALHNRIGPIAATLRKESIADIKSLPGHLPGQTKVSKTGRLDNNPSYT